MKPDYKTREINKLVINLETLGIGKKAINYIKLKFSDIQNNQHEKIKSYNNIQFEKQEYYATQIKFFKKIENIYNSINSIVKLTNSLPEVVLKNNKLYYINKIKNLSEDKDEILLFILKTGIKTDDLISLLHLLIKSHNDLTNATVSKYIDKINNEISYSAKNSTPKR